MVLMILNLAENICFSSHILKVSFLAKVGLGSLTTMIPGWKETIVNQKGIRSLEAGPEFRRLFSNLRTHLFNEKHLLLASQMK